jgi:hypothetical protein
MPISEPKDQDIEDMDEKSSHLPQFATPSVDNYAVNESLLSEDPEPIIDDEIQDEITDEKPLPSRNWATIICFYMSLVCCCLSLVILTLLIYVYWPFKSRNYQVIAFSGYDVVFDVDSAIPVSSRIFKWIRNPPSKRPPWGDHPASRITAKDFWTTTPYPGTADLYDRGHLSPYADLGAESMTVINVVPQVKCHNSGVWNDFEMYCRKTFFDQEIITYPVYNFTSWFETEHGKLYIPYKICKRINNVDYCMNHGSALCGRPWCPLVTPKLGC